MTLPTVAGGRIFRPFRKPCARPPAPSTTSVRVQRVPGFSDSHIHSPDAWPDRQTKSGTRGVDSPRGSVRADRIARGKGCCGSSRETLGVPYLRRTDPRYLLRPVRLVSIFRGIPEQTISCPCPPYRIICIRRTCRWATTPLSTANNPRTRIGNQHLRPTGDRGLDGATGNNDRSQHCGRSATPNL